MSPSKNKTFKHRFFVKVLSTDDGLSAKPQKIGEVPKLAVLLGLLSPKFYDIYELCDGDTTLQVIGEKLGLNSNQILIYTDKLIKSKMLAIGKN